MLDPRDVRVGNWVIKVTGTDNNAKSFFEYKAIALAEYYYTFARACFPIRLTPQVLGTCGFKHEFGDWYKNLDSDGIDDGLPFLRFKHHDASWYFRDTKIPAQPVYLHQLQNLVYALSNQELPVRLDDFENMDIVGPVEFFIDPLRKRSVTRQLL